MPEPSLGARDPHRPRGCTCYRLRRTARQVTRIYDAHLAPSGLTLTQYSLVSALALGKNATPTVQELADILSMDRTTLTRTLKPLMTARLVAFAPGVDRRSKCVTITQAGRTVFDQAKPLWRQAQDEMSTRLGPSRVADLHRLLDDSYDTLAEAS
jgi:DNA-binding MarR family transcriptional regulator